MSGPEASVICYGDVVELHTKSYYHEGASEGCLGFIKDPKGNHQLLVVPPERDGTTLMPAQFIVAPTRDDKPPASNTPLNYRTPFVLKTSDGYGYSLNNKTPGLNETISLQPTGIKGEMYVAILKEGYTSDTNVHDGDMNVFIDVVDSNRIRRTANRPLGHYMKAKSNSLGGFVWSGGKGTVLSFKICKVVGATTPKYIENPVFRRDSMTPPAPETDGPAKTDETKSPEVVSPTAAAGDSKIDSKAAIPQQQEEQPEGNQDTTDATKDEPASTEAPVSPTSNASTAESAYSTDAPAPSTDSAPISATETAPAVEPAVHVTEVTSSSPSTLTTIPIDSEPTSTTEVVPVVDKLTAMIPQEPSSVTVASEGDTVEQVDTGCVGKCSIM